MTSDSYMKRTALRTALYIGALWGIFESTAGYLLHLLPISIGFLVWYPVACFFLIKAYRDSGKPRTVLLTAVMASAIKLLNLLLPGRIDKVLNPAVSILFEGLAVYVAICVFSKVNFDFQKKSWVRAALSLGANSLWRLLFIIYLAFIVPQWMRDSSVLRSSDTLLRFFVTDNLAGSTASWMGFEFIRRIYHGATVKAPRKTKPRIAGRLSIVCLLMVDIGLQLLLK